MRPPGPPDELSLLSFNMQVGVGTKRYREYLTRGWRHLLPSQAVTDNLRRIAEMVAGHDIVGLQEIDAGSRRSRYRNQIEAIAREAGFDYWADQVNRDLGKVAQHGLGLISRYPPFEVTEHKLPGRVPGRGALLARFGTPAAPLTIVVTHLSLGAGSRAQQIEAICGLIAGERNVVVMGDTNCGTRELIDDTALANSDLCVYDRLLPTFPSWRPRRGIDHILTSASLEVRDARVIDAVLSDHRPVAMRVGLPASVGQAMADSRRVRAVSEPQK